MEVLSRQELYKYMRYTVKYYITATRCNATPVIILSLAFDPIGAWNGDLGNSSYLWIDLDVAELPGGVLGARELF